MDIKKLVPDFSKYEISKLILEFDDPILDKTTNGYNLNITCININKQYLVRVKAVVEPKQISILLIAETVSEKPRKKVVYSEIPDIEQVPRNQQVEYIRTNIIRLILNLMYYTGDLEIVRKRRKK